MVQTMAKQTKTENMPTVTKSYGFTECKPVNAIIDKGYIDKKSGNFIIKELDVEIPKDKLSDFIQHALTRALTQDTSGNVSVFTIDAEIAVWQAGYPCLPAWRKAQRETSKLVQSVTGTSSKKLPYTRLDIEAAMRDVTSLDDPRVKIIEAMDDEQFAEFMVLCNDEDFVIDALDLLAKRLREKQERETTDKKAQFAAMLAKAKGL